MKILLGIVLAILVLFLGIVLTNPVDFSYELQIAGGEDADIADYPYMLALSYESTLYCGAVLISPTWALTTAVCTDRISSPDEIRILANSSYHNDSLEVEVARIVQNENYYMYYDYDISLLELKEPLECTYCSPIPLTTSVPELGQTGTLTGFGWTEQLGNYSDVLQVLKDIPIANWTECKDMYYLRMDVTENMFCAGFSENDLIKDFCQGDNGSPFILDGKLTGLASWGYGCSNSTWPGVYTNIAIFLDWIQEYVNDTVILN